MKPPRKEFDASLLPQLKDRDEGAMNAFFEAYIDRVYAYVLAMVKNPSLADDLTQDAFVRMHRGIHTLDPGRDPSPWVFTVVANTVRDHWKSREHRNRGQMVDVDDLWTQEPADPQPPAPVRLATEETQAEIQAALEKLSPADREIILLRTFQDMKTEAVAEFLGINTDAVRQRHSRAVKRLGSAYREVLGEDQVPL